MLFRIAQTGFDYRIQPVDEILVINRHFAHLLARDQLFDLFLPLRVVAAGMIFPQGPREKRALLLQIFIERVDFFLQDILLCGLFFNLFAQC